MGALIGSALPPHLQAHYFGYFSPGRTIPVVRLARVSILAAMQVAPAKGEGAEGLAYLFSAFRWPIERRWAFICGRS